MVSTAKKQASGPAKDADQYRVTGNWVENIEKMSDLGQGYVLVKINTSAPNTPTNRSGGRSRAQMNVGVIRQDVREFSPRQLRQLLEKFSDQLHVTPARKGAVSRPAPEPQSGDDGNDQFMDDLRAQELANRKRDIDAGRLLTSKALAERLELSTQALSKAVSTNRMFTLNGPSGRKFYPAFFADQRFDRDRIETVCQALGDLPGPSKWEFFTSPRESLKDLTPVDALARGMLAQVLRAVTAFRER